MKLFIKMSFFSFLIIAFSLLPVNAENPASTVTTTGQNLTVSINSPADGANFCIDDLSNVEGSVVLGPATSANINVVYVIDVSGSTANTGWSGILDANGNGIAGDPGDDFNGDGVYGDILDCEIAGVLALHESIGNPPGVEVSIVVFGSDSMPADVSAMTSNQIFTTPGADSNGNMLPDIEEVLLSIDSAYGGGGTVGEFTPINVGVSTDYEDALRVVYEVLSTQPDEKGIVFFLSDGSPTSTSYADELSQLNTLDITGNTFRIATAASEIYLQQIADALNGVYTPVDDPSQLTAVLPGVNATGINTVMLNGSNIALSAIGTFQSIINIVAGDNLIEAIATTGDGTSIAADISVVGNSCNQCELSVTPGEGTIGTIVTITGCDFGKSGKVYIDKWKTKILSWSSSSIVVQHVHQLVPGDYVLKVVDSADATLDEGSFTIMAPVLDSLDVVSGNGGDEVTASGFFFGNSASKCTVYLKDGWGWEKILPDSLDMDPVTGESSAVFTIPGFMSSGIYPVYIRNLIDWSADSIDFTVN